MVTSLSSAQAEINRHVTVGKEALQTLTRQLYAGNITGVEWQVGVMAELKDAHLAYAMLARGGREGMTATEWGRVGSNLADEYRWLRKFIDQIAAGEVSESQALARVEQYSQAAKQAYWHEWLAQRDRAEWADLPVLRQVPRDGNTQCYGNCNCQLREGDDGIHWDLYHGETCPDCRALAIGGPYRPGVAK